MFLLTAVLLFQTADPYLLPIGDQTRITVSYDQAHRTSDGKEVSAEEIAKAADGLKWVYLGETHDNPSAHRWQAAVIEALVKEGRRVVVGMEMFTRSRQSALDKWSRGELSEAEFIEQSEWKTDWGFDYALYKPIFDAVKTHKLPLVALNIPRDWVRTVSREGWDALPEEAKRQLPSPYWDNKDHRKVFEALIGEGHPGAPIDSMYRGQVLWDEAMADSAIKFLESLGDDEALFVVIAGNGHLMYDQGINWRVERRTGERGVTVVTVEVAERSGGKSVVAGIGDFVIGTPPPDRGGG